MNRRCGRSLAGATKTAALTDVRPRTDGLDTVAYMVKDAPTE